MKNVNVKIGDCITIISMKYNPNIPGDKEACESYNGRSGVVTSIDDIGQLHGTWGGLAVVLDEDEIKLG